MENKNPVPISVYVDIEQFLPKIEEFATGHEPGWDPLEVVETEKMELQRETWAVIQTALEHLQAAYRTIGWFLYRDRPDVPGSPLLKPRIILAEPRPIEVTLDRMRPGLEEDARRASKDSD